jgi:cysteine synthase A
MPAASAPTPLVPVQLAPDEPAVWCKLEYLHPSGSTKDRIAQFILDKAGREGRLAPGALVVEASSGSTSIAFALACAQRGLRFAAVMPEGVSAERVLLIRAYGGEVRVTPRAAGLAGALAEAERLAAELGAFYPRQFENPDNAAAHRTGTARELLAQLGKQLPGGAVDAVVSGVGTGGTLVGLHQGFVEHGHRPTPVVARPVDRGSDGRAGGGARVGVGATLNADSVAPECSSVVAAGGTSAQGSVPDDATFSGTFSGRVPGVVEGMSAIFAAYRPADLVQVDVPAGEVLAVTRQLHRLGFPVGPSSGLNHRAAVLAARRLAAERGPLGAVVTVFPDRVERYFSTELFRELRDRGVPPAA